MGAAVRSAEKALRIGGALILPGSGVCRSPVFTTSGQFVPKSSWSNNDIFTLTFHVVDFLIYKIEQYLLYYITQKPSGVQIGRLFCMDRREGGGEIITEIHPVKLRNFHEKEVGE